MTKSPRFSLTLAAFAALSLNIVAEARLFQVPIGGGVHHRRGLTGGSDIDLDNLYQARGVQYADLKVGTSPRCGPLALNLFSSYI